VAAAPASGVGDGSPPPAAYRSPQTALNLALFTPLLSSIAGVALLTTKPTGARIVGGVTLGLGLTFGPSVGHGLRGRAGTCGVDDRTAREFRAAGNGVDSEIAGDRGRVRILQERPRRNRGGRGAAVGGSRRSRSIWKSAHSRFEKPAAGPDHAISVGDAEPSNV
jgi:hypothetical protein